jgi:molecular chaperone HscC
VVMTDVSPYSLGIDTAKQFDNNQFSHGHFDPIIERNSIVPISRVKTYHPVQDNQRVLEINVFQGEARMTKDNILLGKLEIALPRAPKAECGVDVRFTYDVNGLLQVEATIQKTQQTHSLLISGNPGMLTESEIAQRFEALSELKIHPRDKMENRTLMARAERLYQQLRGPLRESLGNHILRFERVLDQQELRRIETEARAFEDMLDEYDSEKFINPPEPVQ